MKIPFTNIEVSFSSTQAVKAVDMADQLVPEKGYADKHVPYEFTLNRIKQDIQTWRQSLLMAENMQTPNRQELYRLYRDVVMDAQVTACMTTRKNAILGSRFIVRKDGVKDPELTALLTKKWFYDFIDLSLDSIFYGYSLIQFGDLLNDEFRNCELALLRQYVKQEFDLIVQSPGMITGVNYVENPLLAQWCIGVGGKRDLGLLAKLAPLYLYKKNAMASWSNYSDLFGVPIRYGKTNKKDTATYDSMVNFLKNMGNSAWGVFSKEDDIQLLESGKTSGQDVFDKMIERMNSEIAKLILGQTGTTDEKAFSGSANVHERVAAMYQETDERFIENVFTHQLIPFLTRYHGFDLQGCTIEVEEDSELSLMEKAKIDIELLNTGLYIAPVEYLKETYGTDLQVLNKAEEPKTTKNSLDEYYM